MTATLDTAGDITPKITLDDLREALFNGEAHEKTDFDVFEEMAKDKKGLVKRVAQNKMLIEKAGNPDQVLYELDQLQNRYKNEIQTLEAAKGFEKKVEKQSWGRWALEKVKSVVLFPVRHPVYTILIAAAVLAGVGLYYNYLGTLLTETIPNYSAKVADVLRQGVKFASEELGLATETAYDGSVPLSTSPAPVSPASPSMTGGLFASPEAALPLEAPLPVDVPLRVPSPNPAMPGPGDFGVTPY